MIKYYKKLMYISFVIYMILLIWVIIFKWTNYKAAEECIITFRKLNLIQRYLASKHSFIRFDFFDLLLNSILFFPMGLFYTLLFKKEYFILLTGICCSFIFEISQFFTCIGMFNIFDIIGNVLGCTIGYCLFLIFKKIFSKRFTTIINIIIILLGLPFCIYAIFMTIKNFNYYL